MVLGRSEKCSTTHSKAGCSPYSTGRPTVESLWTRALFSIGSKPLQIWDKKVRNGHIKRITDDDIQSLIVEIIGANVRYSLHEIPLPAQRKLVEHGVHLVPIGPEEDARHQAALLCDGRQEHEEVLHLRSAGAHDLLASPA